MIQNSTAIGKDRCKTKKSGRFGNSDNCRLSETWRM